VNRAELDVARRFGFARSRRDPPDGPRPAGGPTVIGADRAAWRRLGRGRPSLKEYLRALGITKQHPTRTDWGRLGPARWVRA